MSVVVFWLFDVLKLLLSVVYDECLTGSAKLEKHFKINPGKIKDLGRHSQSLLFT